MRHCLGYEEPSTTTGRKTRSKFQGSFLHAHPALVILHRVHSAGAGTPEIRYYPRNFHDDRVCSTFSMHPPGSDHGSIIFKPQDKHSTVNCGAPPSSFNPCSSISGIWPEDLEDQISTKNGCRIPWQIDKNPGWSIVPTNGVILLALV